MTDHEWDILGDYIRWVANEIGLRDWAFLLQRDEPDDKEALAVVCPTYGRKYATVRVCHEFRGIRPEEQRATIVHELLHCHLVLATDAVQQDLNNTMLMSRPTYLMFWEHFKRMVEYAIDGMADAWAKSLPLIDWELTLPLVPGGPLEGPPASP